MKNKISGRVSMYIVYCLLCFVLSFTAWSSHASIKLITKREGNFNVIVDIIGDAQRTYCQEYSAGGSNIYMSMTYYDRAGDIWTVYINSAYPNVGICSSTDSTGIFKRFIGAKMSKVPSIPVAPPMLSVSISYYNYVSNMQWLDINTEPEPEPEPTKCTASVAGDIAFGDIKSDDINGRKMSTTVRVSCDKKANVDVRFIGRNGSDNFDLRSDIRGKLRVGGWDGTNGFRYTANPGVPVDTEVNVTLTANGTVTPGPFRSEGVVKIEIE